ncbi:hypothetical protein JTB14_008743 [Gonioctena quinquepunctata]|nr:hypothetical protein JTB14_008743 [Gonioctena quinquepunctata]
MLTSTPSANCRNPRREASSARWAERNRRRWATRYWAALRRPIFNQQPPAEEQEQRDLELRANESRSIRPLSRALSSPVVHLGPPEEEPTLTRRRASSTLNTDLPYDNQMLKHACVCGNNALHLEHAGRL